MVAVPIVDKVERNRSHWLCMVAIRKDCESSPELDDSGCLEWMILAPLFALEIGRNTNFLGVKEQSYQSSRGKCAGYGRLGAQRIINNIQT